MADPQRHWELSEADFEERKYWDDYMRAYQGLSRNTNSQHAPWYVIPSDKNWYRDAAASIIFAEVLAAMEPKFPPSRWISPESNWWISHNRVQSRQPWRTQDQPYCLQKW